MTADARPNDPVGEGIATVTDNSSSSSTATTGWNRDGNGDMVSIAVRDCAGSGCNVTFDLGYRVTDGSGDYYIVRNVDGSISNVEGSSSSPYNTSSSISRSYSETLASGTSACYTIYFRTSGQSSYTPEAACVATANSYTLTLNLQLYKGSNAYPAYYNYSRVTVNEGDYASVTAPTYYPGYSGHSWCSSGKCGTNGEYLTSNKVYWAYYNLDSHTLSGTPVDAETGSYGICGLSRVSDTEYHGDPASITRPITSGVTFVGWSRGGTGDTYSVSSLTSNVISNPRYYQWKFSGSVSSSTASVIECPNEGCSTSFSLSLTNDTVDGSGTTPYVIRKNGSAVKTSTASSGSWSYSETLKPGQTICYSLAYRSLGCSSSISGPSACVTAETSTFEGKSDVSGAANDTTDWQSSSTKKVAFIDNCDPTSGCDVSFAHALRRTVGIGSTDYTVSRTANYTSSLRAIKVGTAETDPKVASGTFSTNSETVSTSGAWTLYPGMVVCEILTFKPTNNMVSVPDDVSTTICASALGNAQPDDPNGSDEPGNPDDPSDPENPSDPNGDEESDAFIDIQVKNNSVTKYGTYRHFVYAKPGDSLTYRGTYNPKVQYTYYLMPDRIRIDSGTIYSNNTLSSLFMYELFNDHKSPNWNNDTTISSSNFSTSFSQDYTYTNGSVDKRRETNDHTVAASEVGQSLNEINQTNRNGDTKTTPRQVTFYSSGNDNVGNVITSSISATAYARIPYNFNTEIDEPTSEPTCAEKNGTVCAGEESTITFPIEVIPKTNCVTTNNCSEDEAYTTDIPRARKEIIVYDPGNRDIPGAIDEWEGDNLCGYFGLDNNQVDCGYGSIKDNNVTIYANSDSSISATFYIQDKTAGSRVCVAAALYPSNSGADSNWNDSEGSHTWRISGSKCYTIAKKPSMQVWGGNVYSAGQIKTGASIKNNLYGYTNYSVGTANGNNYIFGSWGELGVISNGQVTGLASGAGTGYSDFNPLWPAYHPADGLGNNTGDFSLRDPGGTVEGKLSTSFCLRSLLNFANSPCNVRSVGGMGALEIVSNALNKNKSTIVNSVTSSGSVETFEVSEVGETTVEGSGIYLYQNNDDINIKGNITYKNEGYDKLTTIPKVIVYAKGDIIIDCSVTEIDAVLIADGAVKTCNSDDIDARENSNRLYIFGAIIADSLTVNRTYGAATGANSIIPAEIVNFDPTLYLWGNVNMEASGSSNITTTYVRELSPRQ